MRLSDKKKKSVTIRDVAALTGVSYQTVSRVINRMPEVAAATRARVQQVVAEVGFRPNMTARQLASKRSTIIGLVTFATSFKSHVGGYGQRCPFMVQATDSCTISRRSLG